ncbi:TonB-dependent receptor [Sphingobium indicum]|uniref:TonB-dependent receptor n=1 Tax=Sphingobium indicum TaxID=332055 RepID=UPI00055B619C|nr:TonB-dependent receptor [Sphingobium indicum]
MKPTTVALCSAVSLFAISTSAQAQTIAPDVPPTSQAAEPVPGTDDIVVTATRGASNLQSTPVAITAMTAEGLQKLGISDVESLGATVPGISFGSLVGQSHIAIRGIGSSELNPGVDPRVAYHQDGIYIGRPAAQTGGFFDVERVEILKGPQGALYGRNATAGAINVISRSPSAQTSGYMILSYGNYNTVLAEGAVGGALSSTLSGRISLQGRRRDGFGRNIVTRTDIDDQSEANIRASLRWRPTSVIDIRLIGEYHREDDNAGALHYLGQANPSLPLVGALNGGVNPSNPRDIAAYKDPFVDVQTYAGTLLATFDMDWATLKSYSSIRRSEARFGSNIDGSSFPLSFSTVVENADQISQEFVLTGTLGRLEWLAGVQYIRENIYSSQTLPFSYVVAGGPNLLAQGYFAGGKLINEAIAPYARLKYKLTDRISLVIGGRYTDDNRRVSDQSQFDFTRVFSPTNPVINLPGFPRQAKTDFKKFTPTATLDFQATDNLYAYISYTEGFKAGGYNLGVASNAFEPETIKDFELGVRFDTTDRLLRLNATLFHYDYKNLQLGILRGPVIVIENAAQAELYGADIDVTLRPASALQIDGSFSIIHSEYKDFVSTNPAFVADGPVDLGGNQLTQAPKFTGRVGAQYTIPLGGGEVTLRGDYVYTSRIYFTPWNERAVSQAKRGLLNARLTYERGGWSVEGYMDNITGKRYVAQSYVSNALFGAPVLGGLGAPRTFGVKVTRSF